VFDQLAIGEGGLWIKWHGEVGICADALSYRAHPDVQIDELELATASTGIWTIVDNESENAATRAFH